MQAEVVEEFTLLEELVVLEVLEAELMVAQEADLELWQVMQHLILEAEVVVLVLQMPQEIEMVEMAVQEL
jgi:hypothetical protein